MNKKRWSFCIICGQEFDEMTTIVSEEHIIPEALGNAKITMFGVCKTCNNQLGTRLDHYFTDHIFIKMMRRIKLEKDKNIQIFDTVLPEKRTGQKYKVFNDHVEGINEVLSEEKTDNGGVHLQIEATSLDEGIKLGKKKLKRITGWTLEEIEKSLNHSGAITIGESRFVRPELEQKIEINKSRWLLEGIKIAYEYAAEKLGEDYLSDPIAQYYKSLLYSCVDGKKEYSDEEFLEIDKYCKFFDMGFIDFIEEGKRKYVCLENLMENTRHMIMLISDAEGKLICWIRILNTDYLTYSVLISKDASAYLRLECAPFYYTVMMEDGMIIELGK